jgi:hypothetical protein
MGLNMGPSTALDTALDTQNPSIQVHNVLISHGKDTPIHPLRMPLRDTAHPTVTHLTIMLLTIIRLTIAVAAQFIDGDCDWLTIMKEKSKTRRVDNASSVSPS